MGPYIRIAALLGLGIPWLAGQAADPAIQGPILMAQSPSFSSPGSTPGLGSTIVGPTPSGVAGSMNGFGTGSSVTSIGTIGPGIPIAPGSTVSPGSVLDLNGPAGFNSIVGSTPSLSTFPGAIPGLDNSATAMPGAIPGPDNTITTSPNGAITNPASGVPGMP